MLENFYDVGKLVEKKSLQGWIFLPPQVLVEPLVLTHIFIYDPTIMFKMIQEHFLE
jgi:hypothetical protein